MYALRLVTRDLEVLRQAERRDAVDDPEVDHLRDRAAAPSSASPARRRAPRPRSPCGCPRRARTPRAASARPRRARGCAARSASSRRDSRRWPSSAMNARADLAAELGADRDRLQVRVGRREPARRGDGLVERRVQPAVALRDQRRQRAEVGVQELRELAPLLDHRRRARARRGSTRSTLRVGRVAGLALAARRSARASRRGSARPAASSRS